MEIMHPHLKGMKRLLTSLFVLSFSYGQSQYADAFLEIGTSPRTIAIGQAAVALPSDPSAIIYNPASTGFVRSISLNGLYINQFGLADYSTLGFTIPMGKYYQWGIQSVMLSIGNILERPDLMGITNLEERRDLIRQLTHEGFSTFSDREIAVNFNLSRNIETNIDLGWYTSEIPVKIPIGLNIRVIQKSLHELNGVGIGVDFGSMLIMNLRDLFSYDFLGELVLGSSLTNIEQTRIFWDSKKEDIIPMQWIIGMRYTQSFGNKPIKLALYYQHNDLYPKEGRFGVEWIILSKVFLRFGMNEGTLQSGIGITLPHSKRKISLGYSFSDHDLGHAHRIGGAIQL